MTEHYFPFHKLAEYYDIFSAVWISFAIFFTIYVLVGLVYWTSKDLAKPVGSLYPMRRVTPRTTYKETTTTTTVTAPVEPTKERKRSNKKVRQPVAPKKRKKLT